MAIVYASIALVAACVAIAARELGRHEVGAAALGVWAVTLMLSVIALIFSKRRR